MPRPANDPNQLERLFLRRADAGDLEGLVALYEPGAVLADGQGRLVSGRSQIRDFLAEFLARRPRLAPSRQAPALRSGDLALTSSVTGIGHVTAEIARRQPDDSWLWVVDQFALQDPARHLAPY